jgi:hypothetical protein
VTRIAEGVHRSVLDSVGLAGGAAPGKAGGITGMVYEAVHDAALLVGKALDTLLARLEPLFESAELAEPGTPEREAVLAALNGVMGDRLAAMHSPFATRMSLRCGDAVQGGQAWPPGAAAGAKLLLPLHGLCMNDLQWRVPPAGQAAGQGDALAAALGYTAVYVRYNSGLHVSQNGRELSARIEQLVAHWPVAIEEIAVLAHSMGGLLIRSALHYAALDGLRWPACLKSIVFMGTPHHGAPLERAGNWVDAILGSTPYSAPFAKLGQLRSAGITDLRYGLLLDQDWAGHDRFRRKPDNRVPVPLPAGVACYAIAATLGSRRGSLTDRLVGDGLVPLRSALGQHDDPRRSLPFARQAQWIAYRTGHVGLLTSTAATRRIARWLAAP